MDDATLVTLIAVFEVLLAGTLVAVLPLVSRRGLLFGAYVGERHDRGPSARDLKRSWFRQTTVLIAACLGVSLAVGLTGHPIAAVFVALGTEIAGLTAIYVRHHRRALGLAVPASSPGLAAASLLPVPAGTLVFPALALAINLTLGVVVTAYAARQYDRLPGVVPIHFKGSGLPDGWAKKSFASVMAMPLGTLLMGAMVAGIGLLTAQAKRSLRADDQGISLYAQQRYRNALARFLSGISLVMTAMLSGMSYDAVRIGLGDPPTFGPWLLACGGLVAAWAIGGSIYLIVRYGQGGARLEAAIADRPLTNGLADDRNWRWGVFYVNREDPSLMIEKRFGVGYTLNFGNPRAIVIMIGIVVVIGTVLGLALAAVPARH
ncbi:MAG: DUF5808 domain-containing protein [Acidobacteriota bacterium]